MTLHRLFEPNTKKIVKKAIKTGEIILIPQHGETKVDQMKVLTTSWA